MKSRGVRRFSGWVAVVSAVFLLQGGAFASAAQTRGPEERIREVLLRVERAVAPLDEVEAATRLAAAFRVPQRGVAELRDQKLGFGDVAAVLALAEAGKTSPDTILSLWASGRLNWEQIAERLKVDLRDLLHRLETVRRELGPRSR